MRPHKITIDETNGVWVDLDSVLAIHDPFIPSRLVPRRHPFVVPQEGVSFSFVIVLAFQDKPKTIEIFEANDIDRMIGEHEALLQAWKSTCA
jgi:hypothetical protein